MSKPAPAFTAAELRRMRAAVEDAAVKFSDTARRFQISHHTLARIAESNGWRMDHRRRKAADARAGAVVPG